MKGAGVLVAAFVLAIGFSGCVGGETGLEIFLPSGSDSCRGVDTTGVDNRESQFHYGGAAVCKNEKKSYDWSNPMPRASVDWAGATSSGSVDVQIRDSIDQVVYEFSSEGTSASGESATTDHGVPGPSPFAWTIELEFRNFTGSVGLDVGSML